MPSPVSSQGMSAIDVPARCAPLPPVPRRVAPFRGGFARRSGAAGRARTRPVRRRPAATLPAVNVLGIESSCDETGVALVSAQAQGVPRLCAQALHSQAEMHQAYGGVVPELASRDHIRRVLPLTRQVLAEAGATLADVDLVAYTRGPGLAGALLVGAGVAVALGAALQRPTVGVHHLEGHLLSPFLVDDPDDADGSAPRFPFVALLVSGGHTQLMRVDAVGRYVLLGETVDDAAGEAFDKSAKLLGLGYPGGPALARLAAFGDADAFDLPRPLLHSGQLDFSFAGLKTAVMTRLQKLGPNVCEQSRADLAAATQQAIVDVLAAKAVKALEATGLRQLVVAGGVGANALLRATLDRRAARLGAQVHYPPPSLCTDNGAMIALAAALRWQHGLLPDDAPGAFDVRPRWPLDELAAA
jgi:N6-L-threonylcarbamoyladenine synthase